MNRQQAPRSRSLSRRQFLGLAAVGGFVATSGYALFEYAPWLDYDQQAGYSRRPFEADASQAAPPMHELIRYATLAANGHNAQPWNFAVEGQTIELHPDYTRRLPVVDPQDRELWISLGCALENLLIAARAVGYAAEVRYPEAEAVIRIRLTSDAPQESPLFGAITRRQSNRAPYNGQPVPTAELDELAGLPLEAGVRLRLITAPSELGRVAEYVREGTVTQYGDKAFVDELMHWLRFTQKEALAGLDGLYTRCSGNPEVPRWLGQLFVGGATPEQQAEADTQKLRSAPQVVVIGSTAEDKAAWVRTGQVYERLALTMTTLGIQSAFLNQPIEAASLRSAFQSAVNLGEAAPQLLLRFGYANAMPTSLRRPVEQVLIPA